MFVMTEEEEKGAGAVLGQHFTVHRTLLDPTRRRGHVRPWRSSSRKQHWRMELLASLQSQGRAPGNS